MKIALLQHHSKNNTDLYQLTLLNHVKYCERHEYDMIQLNVAYSPILDKDVIKQNIINYDAIFAVGSDVFTLCQIFDIVVL